MKKTLLLLAAVTALPLSAGAALAQPAMFKERYIERVDTNKDGAIEKSEVEAAMAKRFARLDKDKDGSISEAEIDAMRERIAERAGAAKTVAGNRLARRDQNGDGVISKAEFVRVPPMFALADKNSDGVLDKSELDAAAAAFAGR